MTGRLRDRSHCLEHAVAICVARFQTGAIGAARETDTIKCQRLVSFGDHVKNAYHGPAICADNRDRLARGGGIHTTKSRRSD